MRQTITQTNRNSPKTSSFDYAVDHLYAPSVVLEVKHEPKAVAPYNILWKKWIGEIPHQWNIPSIGRISSEIFPFGLQCFPWSLHAMFELIRRSEEI